MDFAFFCVSKTQGACSVDALPIAGSSRVLDCARNAGRSLGPLLERSFRDHRLLVPEAFEDAFDRIRLIKESWLGPAEGK
jgi:hypothetical protein